MIPFGEWLPDLPAHLNAGATEALNVIPAARGYRPLKTLNVYSNGLDARCRGAVSAQDKNGANYTYAGTAAKLYRLVDVTMTDSSKAGGYVLGSAAGWEFVKWGETAIAVSIDAAIQSIALGGTAFGDLVTSTRKPKAHHIAVVRDFVVLGNVTDSVDGAVPYRVWWSAVDNPADFQPGGVTQCDYQDLPGVGGAVMRVVGGEYGVVVQRQAIVRMSYEGSPTVFRFDEVDRNRGAIAAGSVANFGNAVFFIADDGFYAFDGAGSQPIGEGKVNKAFLADLDPAYLDRISSAVDPVNAVVMWVYPGSGNSNGTPNKAILYHWPTARWARAEFESEQIFRGISAGYTLDGLDSVSGSLDALPASLDDPLWKGGAINLAGFTSLHKLGYFTGDAMAATLETGEAQLVPGRRSFLRGVKPFVEGSGTVTVQVGTRNLQSDSVTWGAAAPLNALGLAEFRSDARYHRARVNIAGDFTQAFGVEAEARPTGLR